MNENKNGTTKWMIGLSLTVIIMIISLTLNIVNRTRENAAIETREDMKRRMDSTEETVKVYGECLTELKTQVKIILEDTREMKLDLKEIRKDLK